MADAVIEIGEGEFEERVVAESRRRPVVVDFWAPWCGPCRTIGPVLEKLAKEADGRWLLAKVNTDERQAEAAQFRITGIPAVKAFRDGAVVDEFTGAVPEAQIRKWIEGIVPGPADEAFALATAHRTAMRNDEAKAALEVALAANPRHSKSLLALAEIALERQDTRLAEELILRLPPEDALRLAPVVARIRLKTRGKGTPAEWRAKIAANADDHDAVLGLGWSLAANGDPAGAFETWLALVARFHKQGAGEVARRAMLELFDAVGARSELAETWRGRLAQELYK